MLSWRRVLLLFVQGCLLYARCFIQCVRRHRFVRMYLRQNISGLRVCRFDHEWRSPGGPLHQNRASRRNVLRFSPEGGIFHIPKSGTVALGQTSKPRLVSLAPFTRARPGRPLPLKPPTEVASETVRTGRHPQRPEVLRGAWRRAHHSCHIVRKAFSSSLVYPDPFPSKTSIRPRICRR